MARFSHTRVDSQGFTLVEMVTALFIIGILVAIVLGTGRDAVRQSRHATVRADLHFAADALDRFYLVFGEYPEPAEIASGEEEGTPGAPSSATVLPLDFSRKTLDGNDDFHFAALFPKDYTGLDPWGRPYLYELTPGGDDDPPLYSLRSRGPDGKEGNEDDIEYPR